MQCETVFQGLYIDMFHPIIVFFALRKEHRTLSINIACQFGFRRRQSTHHALISLVDKLPLVETAMMTGVLPGLQYTFDRVSHNIFTERYGNHGGMHDCFFSYLSNRMQYIVTNNITMKENISFTPISFTTQE